MAEKFVYQFIEGNHICDMLQASKKEINDLQYYWDNLEIDPYLENNISSRKRRIMKLKYNQKDQTLKGVHGDNSFIQNNSINKLFGGKVRYFSEVDQSFCSNFLLKKIIKFVVNKITESSIYIVNINTHLFRIECNEGKINLPTPEGIHRDGHDFVSQHLISKKNIIGGVSGIYKNENDAPIMHKQLYYPLDTIILNDRELKHDVTPILPKLQQNIGYRDMLIIDYNFENQ